MNQIHSPSVDFLSPVFAESLVFTVPFGSISMIATSDFAIGRCSMPLGIMYIHSGSATIVSGKADNTSFIFS